MILGDATNRFWETTYSILNMDFTKSSYKIKITYYIQLIYIWFVVVCVFLCFVLFSQVLPMNSNAYYTCLYATWSAQDSKRHKKAQLSLTNPSDTKACQNCSNSTCLQRCRWQYWPVFMRLTAIASEIRKIPRNSLKIQTYGVQGHPRSSILVSIESQYVPCY